MKIKLISVFVAGIYIALSTSFAFAEGANANNSQMNHGVNSNTNHMNDNGVNAGNRKENRDLNEDNRNANRDLNTDEDTRSANRDEETDNSKMNSKERNNSGVTAQQQSNSKKDIEITQRIRKELLEDGNLSTYAKNIKVITRKGKVVLKGPVNSLKEKNVAQKIATNAVGAQNVQNEITIVK